MALRVERSERKAGDFEREHAKQLLAELEPDAIAMAKDLNQWAAQAAELKRRWTAHQKRTDELVALVPGASPRSDCPSTEHPLGSAFKELERHGEVQPYLPNWSGLDQRSRTDEVHRLVRPKRQKASESEIEQLRHELTPREGAA